MTTEPSPRELIRHAPRTGALLALFGAILCWSSVPLFLRYFTAHLDAWTVNGVRYGIAAILLAPLLFRLEAPPGRSIWRDAWIPALINTIGQVGWALTPYYIPAGVMGFGIRSAFFFTLLAGVWLLPDERRILKSPLFWIGAVGCISGIGLLFRESIASAHLPPLGLILLFATAAVWGIYGVSVRRSMQGYAAHHSFAVICLYTAVILGILAPLLGHPGQLLHLSPKPLILLAVSAIIGIAIAHVLMYRVLHRFGALVQSGGEFMTPFLTYCGAAWLFGERLASGQWIGGVAVIGGSLLMIRARIGIGNR
jgi:drug/metabolite transporter (DMT)-like permease